jgi:uncharacterized repeat protein (TIGR03803 family)
MSGAQSPTIPVIPKLLVTVLLSLLTSFQPAQAQTLTIIHSFTGGADGGQPFGSLTHDKAGNLYGNTNHGGVENLNCDLNGTGCGTVFALTPSTAGWSFDVIYSFGGYPVDGGSPVTGAMVFDKQGNLYGTTMLGGTVSCEETQGCGTVFKLSPSQTGWTETLLWNFSNAAQDVFWPRSGVVIGKDGNLYGTAFDGGPYFNGGVFEVMPSGSQNVLYNFSGGANGAGPYGGLVFDKKGNLYGTTEAYGSGCCGTVFKIAADGTETVLHSFVGGADGDTPLAGLIFDKHGNLYGTTRAGGGTICGGTGCGTVFQLAPDGTETILHAFDSSDGAAPSAGVILDAKGNLYGTTAYGGDHNSGTVFELTPSAGGWTERVLHHFNQFDGADGALPQGSLFLWRRILYGTTQYGGIYDQGTVFQLNTGK